MVKEELIEKNSESPKTVLNLKKKLKNLKPLMTTNEPTTPATPSAAPQQTQARLIGLVQPLLQPLGYEVVHVEVQTARQKVLRVFIDHLGSASTEGTIGVEDCVKATKALDEPLDQISEIDALFQGAYDLEVSSPGVDRPLRTENDFDRFAGRQVRIHTFRPLNEGEIANAPYLAKNPKQKNFLGKLEGFRDGKVRLSLVPLDGKATGKKGKAPSKAPTPATNSAAEITIPLPLISKANIEPEFDFGDK